MSSGLTYQLLGPVSVTRDGIALAIGGPKQRAVLAVLASRPNTSVSLSAIAGAVWEDNPPPTFASVVQVYVSGLRRALAQDVADGPSPIESSGGGYRLNVSVEQLDITRFRAARTAGKRLLADGDAEGAACAFSQALAQWQGPALADLQDLLFAQQQATALDEERLRTLEDRIAADLECERHAEVIGELTVLTREHPLREPLWGQLITALYLDGRQAEALDAYRRLRACLADELGLDPSPPLRELERKILQQEHLGKTLLHRQELDPNAGARTLHSSVTWARRAVLHRPDGGSIPVGPAGLRIGRMPDNDLVLDSPKVSRYHAALTLTPVGFSIADLHSTNGTEVNGQRLVQDHVLDDSDEIVIGPHRLVYRHQQS